jgi:hypothetical protein
MDTNWYKTAQEEPWLTGKARPFKFDPNSTENEGRFRLQSPDVFDKDTYFRRKSSTPGVSYVMAKKPGEKKAEIQAVRFDKGSFTEEQAAKWMAVNAERLGRPDLMDCGKKVEQEA